MRCDLLGGWRHDALPCCPQCARRGETRTRTKYLFFRSPLSASTLPTRIASERIDGRHVTAGQGVEPVCRAAAAGRRRGAGRPVAGRFVAPARDRPAARTLPPARYVMVRLAARGGTAGVDGHAAVAAGVPLLAFLAGVMRSLCDEQWRRHRRQEHLPILHGGGGADDPEQTCAAAEALAAIQRLFASDEAALKVITGMISGIGAEEIRCHCDMTAVEYDTTRRRIRRTILRHGLAWSWP